MKFNKWTLGLAAMGAVSLTSVAQAEEKMNVLQTAMTSTTISGYVDTSMQWNPGTGNTYLPRYSFGGPSKADGFNLNVVQLTIAKPLDEGEWASGYRADLWFGPDANTLNTLSSTALAAGSSSSDLAIRQAYVTLRTPVGNGIDWKIGVFDDVIGYEGLESGGNPNMTRSYGFSVEPTTLTGLLSTYRFCDIVSASLGIVDTTGPTINGRANPPKAESFKAYCGNVVLTAPSNWGWVAGSTLYAGFLTGFDSTSSAVLANSDRNRQNYYVGATMATPVTGLKAGIAFDYAHMNGNSATTSLTVSPNGTYALVDNQYCFALYGTYQATEKMSLNLRAESYRQQAAGGSAAQQAANNNIFALTTTVQYDLWQNVISRLELRWDYSNDPAFGQSLNDLQHNAVMVAANFIYKF